MGTALALIASGPPGSGKTEWARRILRSCAGSAGVICPAEGEAKAYELHPSLRRGLLGFRLGDDPEPEGSWLPYKRFRFDPGAILAVNEAMIASAGQGLPLLAIDEIGPLELELSDGFLPALRAALRWLGEASRSPRVLALTVRPACERALIAAIRGLAPSAEVALVEIDAQARDGAYRDALTALRRHGIDAQERGSEAP